MIELRPSNARRWVNCPASPRLEAPFPDLESEDAKEGTAAHWVAAQILGGHHQIEELTDRAAPNGVIVDGEMVEHVQFYVDAVGPGAVIERQLPTAIPGIADGTPDARRVDDRGTGYIDDFKYGYAIVEAHGNWQLACYALALMRKHSWQLDRVVVRIIQPRPFHPDGRIRTWTIERVTAERLWHTLTEAVAAAHAPDAPARTGPHCRDCRALQACEAARRAGMNGVDVSLRGMNLEQPVDALAGELRTLRRAAEAIKLRLDAIEGHALALIDRGGVIPGFRVERSAGRRRWRDPDQIAILEALSGLKLTEVKPVSPAQAEKRGADKLLVQQFTTTPETGRKLVERDGSTKATEVFGT